MSTMTTKRAYGTVSDHGSKRRRVDADPVLDNQQNEITIDQLLNGYIKGKIERIQPYSDGRVITIRRGDQKVGITYGNGVRRECEA